MQVGRNGKCLYVRSKGLTPSKPLKKTRVSLKNIREKLRNRLLIGLGTVTLQLNRAETAFRSFKTTGRGGLYERGQADRAAFP